MTGRRLDGRNAIVTGGASGLGRASARRLAAEGAHVAIADLNDALAESLEREITDAGGRALAVHCDVTDEASVVRAFDTAVERFGELSVLHANAGVASMGTPTHEMTVDDFDRTISINLRGAFLAVRQALASMLRAGGGSIVITGSTSSVVAPNGGSPDYRASKHGVLGLAKAVAVEYASRNIRVNCACPGSFPGTNLVAGTLFAHRGITEVPSIEMRSIEVPMGRDGELEEFASVVAFLASADASYITGQAILVDGGYTATGGSGRGGVVSTVDNTR